MLATARFAREFLRARDRAVVVEETTYARGEEVLPATLYRPRAARGPAMGWVPLHGLTYHGRQHDSLRRLARSLAAAGAVVLVPDIPEWRALRVAPGSSIGTIRAAVLALDSLALTEPGRIGVMGFSFGATQALVAATDPALQGHLAGIAAWGGYADLATVTRYMFLGDHELDGTRYRSEPDPYGRWILAGNYAELLPELGAQTGLASAWLGLAHEAARRRLMAWDPALDPAKAAARAALAPANREIFDLIAPPTGTTLSAAREGRLRGLVSEMLDAAVAREPLLDPGAFLPHVPVPVFLAHGRHDRLIPWTEMVRLARALPSDRVRSASITGLFAHSGGEPRRPGPALLVESARFLRLMSRMLRLI
jgi:acetyl esterase/lipase